MKKQLAGFIGVICSAVMATAAPAADIPYPDALADANVTVTSLANGNADGLLLGNGDLYGLVWERGGELIMRVTKNDIWDARLDTSQDGPLPKVDVVTGEVTGSTGTGVMVFIKSDVSGALATAVPSSTAKEGAKGLAVGSGAGVAVAAGASDGALVTSTIPVSTTVSFSTTVSTTISTSVSFSVTILVTSTSLLSPPHAASIRVNAIKPIKTDKFLDILRLLLIL